MNSISENNQEEQLTDRELEVIQLIAGGMSSKEIAAELNIAVSTVCAHRRNIIRKTKTANTTQAAIKFSKGLI